MLVFLHSPNQDKGTCTINFFMQLASISVLEDKQVQGSFFGVLSHIINPLLTKLVWSRWLDIGLILFLLVYGPRLRVGP